MKTNKFIFFFFAWLQIAIFSVAQPPVHIWSKMLPGNVEAIQRATVVDSYGNVYITGVFFGTVDFDPGPGITNVTPVPYGCNIYLAKYDATGNFLWVKNIPIIASYGNNSMAIDGNNNFYLTGFYSGSNIDFNAGAGVAQLSSVAGSNDLYIVKYDLNGNYLWAKSIGSTGDDRGNEILTDASGNVFVTGNFSATVDFDPGGGIANLTSAGLSDIFFAKYDCNGNYIWARQIGGTGTDDVRDIGLSIVGNIYLTGNFSATSDFDPGPGTFNLNSAGNSDIFIGKYDAGGNFLWANRFGGTGTDGGSAIKTDASGNILVTGIFAGTVDFDPAPTVVNLTTASSVLFYGRYDANGNYLWIKQLPLNFYSMDISYDVSGNIFIAGNYGNGYSSPIDMDPGPGIANLSVPSNLPPPTYNVLGMYDSNGNYLWAGVFGHQCYCSVMGYKSSLYTDAAGYLYYSGIFNGSSFGSYTVDFDPGAGVANLTAASSVDNTFFVKYGTAIAPLPVELISFSGVNTNNTNHITWTTASENNNDYFDVERSTDGEAYERIGKVNGNGKSSQVLNYNFNDMDPWSGVNYYRLKQVDYNGEYRFSNTIALDKKNEKLSFWFTGDVIQIMNNSNNTITLRIWDSSGKLIKQLQIQEKEFSCSVNELTKGIYFVQLFNNHELMEMKIFKK